MIASDNFYTKFRVERLFIGFTNMYSTFVIVISVLQFKKNFQK
jgi:hypothetical protein